MWPTASRLLAAYVALALILPPGWCCLLRAAGAEPAASQPAPCCGCEHCSRKSAPDDEKPTPPPPANKCPCMERQSTAPDESRPTLSDDAGLTLVMPADLSVPALSPTISHPDHSPHPDVPVHLCLCVWRC